VDYGMALKSRCEWKELKIMRSLNIRSNLSPTEKKYFFKLPTLLFPFSPSLSKPSTLLRKITLNQ
jgi:hypothetical protein